MIHHPSTPADLHIISVQPARADIARPVSELDLVPVHVAPHRSDPEYWIDLLGCLPLTIVTVDVLGTIMHVVKTRSGLPHADLIGRDYLSLAPAEVREPLREVLHRVASERVEIVVEVMLPTAQELLRWVEAHFSPMVDPDGEIREIVSSTVEITGRRRNEELLRRRGDAMSILMEMTTQLLGGGEEEFGSILTRTLELLCVHAEMSGGLLYELDEHAGGLTLLREWHAPGDKATAEHLERSMQPRTEMVFHDLLAGRDVQITRGPSHPPRTPEEGQILDELETNSLLAVPIMTRRGLRGFMAFNSTRVLDGWSDDMMQVFHVTANLIGGAFMRLEADADLRRSEHRWRFAVEGSGLATWEWDMVKDVVSFSSALSRMLGYNDPIPSGNMIAVSQMLHPDDVEAATQGFFRYLEGGVPTYQQEYRLRTADGGWRWVAARALIDERDGSGRPLHLIGTYTDITEQHQSEEQLMRTRDALLATNQELERLARLKDAYLANMSHELRTPLTSILGMTEVLQLQSAENLSDRQQHYLGVIAGSGRHLLALINDVLDVAKIEAGMLELASERAVLDEICAAAHAIVSPQASSKSITLDLRLAHPPIECQVDARRMMQVILNLLSNAVKFTPEGGRVTLATAADASAGRVRISVRDTGIGIAPEELAQLFTPYKQLRGVPAEGQQGTGLGLVLARSIARLHDGDIHVESTPGVGSTFTIDFPWVHPERRRKAASPAGTEAPAAGAGRAMQAEAPRASSPTVSRVPSRDVLLWMVDVSPEVDALEDALTVRGHALHHVVTEREVRRTLLRLSPSVAIVVMPGSIDDLHAAVRWLRGTVHGTLLRIIAIGIAPDGGSEGHVVDGADVFLPFPVDAARVDAMLRGWMEPAATIRGA